MKLPKGSRKHGHKALAHLVIRHGETQIIPWSGDIHGDGEQLVFDEVYELKSEDVLVLEGWNDDVQYPHRFIVRLLILPQPYAFPELAALSAFFLLPHGSFYLALSGPATPYLSSIFLLPHGSFFKIFKPLYTSCVSKLLSTPSWEFLCRFAPHGSTPKSFKPFYSLMGVS